MGRPVRRCSSPSSSMIWVPEAAPVAQDRAADRAPRTARSPRAGSRPGRAGTGSRSTMPIISQCPVVVSLPAERSAHACRGRSRRRPRGTTPSTVVSSPRPSASRLRRVRGRPRPRRRGPACRSPRRRTPAASGASPTPNESHTMTTPHVARRGRSSRSLRLRAAGPRVRREVLLTQVVVGHQRVDLRRRDARRVPAAPAPPGRPHRPPAGASRTNVAASAASRAGRSRPLATCRARIAVHALAGQPPAALVQEAAPPRLRGGASTGRARVR